MALWNFSEEIIQRFRRCKRIKNAEKCHMFTLIVMSLVGLVVQQQFFSSNNVVYANLKHVSALLFVQFSNTLFRLR